MSNSPQPLSVEQLIQRAHRALRPGGDAKLAVEAISLALKQMPRDLGLILFLGDAHHAAEAYSDAGQAYTMALRLASQISPSSIPPGIVQALQRAEARCAEYAETYETFLRSRLPDLPPESRFAHTLDILLGRRRIYVQQPTKLYFPGLPHIQFYNPSMFEWAKDLEAKTSLIRDELLAVLEADQAFAPYLPKEQDGQPHLRSTPLQGSLDWSAFYIWKDGARIEENAARCPVTTAAMEAVPLDFLPGQSPSVLFSRLKPGAHIPPHCGLVNTRLIGHLPLIVPGPSWLRVGNEVHDWKEGQLVVFDDTIEHEAKNEGSDDRIVLLFDFWRPELTLEEREQVATLISAISEYQGVTVARES